ncbi:helix-hairpin-helix domain-containing protein [Nocardioides sp. Bht2]|uniref:helix-hairpin-helix domain-containing protein n=1 Tax=Nocardioides sp. Bht2 TaxID=3392297 RepID=UPI0039B41455
MRGRGAEQHAEAVARRLELLRAELGGAAEEHTRIRALPPTTAADGGGPPPPPLAPASPPPAPHFDPVPGPAAPVVLGPGRHASRRRVVAFEELRGRVALGSPHLIVAVLLAVLAVALAGWWVLRSGGSAGELPEPALASPLAAVSGLPEGPVPPTASAEPEVVVDVAGKVRRPGIVVLPRGARVVDALAEAGGARRGVELTGLNLARVLVDGEQIVVGGAPPSGIAASAAPEGTGSVGTLVNLNTASLTELDDLPGVGPVTAQAIVEWRDANGGFRAVDQLLEVDGIGEKTLADLAPHVTL